MEEQKPVIPGSQGNQNRKGPKFNLWWIYGLFALVILVMNFWGKGLGNSVREDSFQNIDNRFIQKNLVDSMIVYNKYN